MSTGDRWLSKQAEASRKGDEVEAALNARTRQQRARSSTTQITNQTKTKLQEYTRLLFQLEADLHENSGYITDKEFARREQLLDNLRGREQRFNTDLKQTSTAPGPKMSYNDRDSLIGASYREEDDRTRGLDHDGLMSQQDQIMRDQDAGLDILAQSIARQKQLGLAIGEEVDEQNEMLDDLDDAMDNTHRRLKRETAHVTRVSEKAQTGCMCCTMVLLIIAIIVVAAVPI